jgi:hypothetical protein
MYEHLVNVLSRWRLEYTHLRARTERCFRKRSCSVVCVLYCLPPSVLLLSLTLSVIAVVRKAQKREVNYAEFLFFSCFFELTLQVIKLPLASLHERHYESFSFDLFLRVVSF